MKLNLALLVALSLVPLPAAAMTRITRTVKVTKTVTVRTVTTRKISRAGPRKAFLLYAYRPYAVVFVHRFHPETCFLTPDLVVELNRKERLAVLIVEQNIDLIQKVASRAYVLDKGRVVRTLEKNEIRNTERLAEFLAI